MKLEKSFAWTGILVLGTTAIALGSFPVVFRYSFFAFLAFLLIAARMIQILKNYIRVLDVFFIITLIWHLPLLSLYKMFHSAGREFFFQIFGENDLVKGVADNSISGLLWVFLPIILVLLERDSLKSIFIKKGKITGWIAGASLLLILLAVASFIAWASSAGMKMYFSLLPLGLVFAVLNSVKEEVLYRGLIFSRTLQFGFGFSLLCQFLWFSLIHVLYSGAAGKSFGMFLGIGVFTILAAWMTKKFDSLICPVLVHTGIDLIIFIATIPHNYSA